MAQQQQGEEERAHTYDYRADQFGAAREPFFRAGPCQFQLQRIDAESVALVCYDGGDSAQRMTVPRGLTLRKCSAFGGGGGGGAGENVVVRNREFILLYTHDYELLWNESVVWRLAAERRLTVRAV